MARSGVVPGPEVEASRPQAISSADLSFQAAPRGSPIRATPAECVLWAIALKERNPKEYATLQ
jgi:hypothetical protein